MELELEIKIDAEVGDGDGDPGLRGPTAAAPGLQGARASRMGSFFLKLKLRQTSQNGGGAANLFTSPEFWLVLLNCYRQP